MFNNLNFNPGCNQAKPKSMPRLFEPIVTGREAADSVEGGWKQRQRENLIEGTFEERNKKEKKCKPHTFGDGSANNTPVFFCKPSTVLTPSFLPAKSTSQQLEFKPGDIIECLPDLAWDLDRFEPDLSQTGWVGVVERIEDTFVRFKDCPATFHSWPIKSIRHARTTE